MIIGQGGRGPFIVEPDGTEHQIGDDRCPRLTPGAQELYWFSDFPRAIHLRPREGGEWRGLAVPAWARFYENDPLKPV